jgi:hypothetical protein
MNQLSMLLQFAVVILSLLSGAFWLASATGRGIDWPWRPIVNPTREELPAHQAKWNSAAAGCAAGAALAQAVFFLIERPLP